VELYLSIYMFMAWTGGTWLAKDTVPWSQVFSSECYAGPYLTIRSVRRSAVSTYLLSKLSADSHKFHTAVLNVFLDSVSNNSKLYEASLSLWLLL